MGLSLCRSLHGHADNELMRLYNLSTFLPLIGADHPDVVMQCATLKRTDERFSLHPTDSQVLLVYEGCIDVYYKNQKIRSIRASRTPLPSSSSSSARSRFSRSSIARSVRYDDNGYICAEEMLIYWKAPNEYVCRYSCQTRGEEVILKSTLCDRIVPHHRTRYMSIATKMVAEKTKNPQPLHAVTSSDVLDLLGGIPFFAGISREKLISLTEMSTIRVYPAESVIFREDEGLSTQMFVTLAGTLEVISSKAPKPLAKLEAGSFFGEMSLLIHIPRAATVRVVESCMLMSIEKDSFHSFLEKSPDVKVHMYNLLKERLLTKAMLSGVLPFFNTLPLPRVIQLSHTLQIEDQVRTGDVILDQDLDDSKFGLLVYGALEICSQDLRRQSRLVMVNSNRERVSVFLTPGCYFGPHLFTRLSLSHCRIIARSAAVVLSCSMDMIMQLFQEYPQVAAEANIAWYGERCDLPHVLRHAVLTQRFQTFLEAEHSDENFGFCMDVENFRASLSTEERAKLAAYIRDRYVVADSPKEVNLPASIRDALIERMQKLEAAGEPVPTTLFDTSYEEIMRLMTKDSFPRFKKSPLFQSVLGTLDPHIARKGSVLVEACSVFRESLSMLRPGKVDNVPVTRLNNMLKTIRKTQTRNLGRQIEATSSIVDISKVRVAG